MGSHPGTSSFSIEGYVAEKHGEAVRLNVRGKALAAQYLLPSEPDNNDKGKNVSRWSRRRRYDTISWRQVPP